MSLGVRVFIGHGKGTDKFLDVLRGEGDGTYISSPSAGSINTSRQWIALHSETVAKIYVDQGAEEAILYHGRSLLPAGIVKLEGEFEKGDVVEVYGTKRLLGKGEVNYSSAEVREQLRLRKELKKEQKKVAPSIEIIHRNHWVEI